MRRNWRLPAGRWPDRPLLVLVLLFLALASCQVGAMRVGPASVPASQNAMPGSERVGPASVPASRADARATVVIHIRWPDRDYGGFRAATIPTSTNAVYIRIAGSTGATLADRLVTRQPAETTVSVAFDLPATQNASVEAKAYREDNPTIGVSTPIAQGTAAGQNFGSSQTTTVSIGLTALFVPSIASFSVNVGQVAEAFTLYGDNLGLVGDATPSVAFEGLSASVSAQVTPVDAGTLRVAVPAGAAVGRVVVTSDGVPSVSNAVFWVIGGVTIDAPRAAWDPSPTDSRLVLFGETLQLVASPAWALRDGKTATSYGTPPAATWATSNGPAGSLGTGGLFTAATSYATSSVTARMGSAQSAPIEVRSEDVTGLAIAKSPADPAGLTLTGVHTLSDGATFSGWTTFATASTSVATIDASGSVRPVGAGQLTATASSQVRSARTAMATMTITSPKFADDSGDAEIHHDYLVTRNGVTSIFVWVPEFTAYQLINPGNCGAGNTDKPAGYWVANQPGSGTQDADWARETFGGFYAAKYEASRSDASASVMADGSDATAGSSGTLKVQARCEPWLYIPWDEAVGACRAFHTRADLLGDTDWTAMAVWAMTRGITVFGNNDRLQDVNSASTTFVNAPSGSGFSYALTGTGRNPAWSGAQNLTTHTGTIGGVFDLNGNVWEWTRNLGGGFGGNILVDGVDTGVTLPPGGKIETLSADPKLRRHGVPATTGSSIGLFGLDFFNDWYKSDPKPVRGGRWDDGDGAGLWYLYLGWTRTDSSARIGFRPVLRSWNLTI